MINIKSLLTLFEEVCKKEKVLYKTYVPTYKFSQDHLEMLFSIIRSHGGLNNNLTVKQFKSAFKKIIIRTEVSAPSTGYCIPLEKILILNVSSTKKTVHVINNSSSSSLHQWTDILHRDENHDYIKTLCYITEFILTLSFT